MSSGPCRHLAPLARALRRAGAKTDLSMRAWSEHRGFRGRSVYLDWVMDRRALESEGLVPPGLEYKEYGVDGRYAGFFCGPCQSSLTGWRPGYLNRPRPSRPRRSGPFI